MIELTDEILAKVIKKRKKASYKGTYGRLLVIGGNRQYGGGLFWRRQVQFIQVRA